MTNVVNLSPQLAPKTLTSVHRAWLVVLVLAQLTFLFVMPVFAGNDERTHMDRMWAIAEGHFQCETLPQAVRDVDTMRLHAHAEHFGHYWRRGLLLTGGANLVDGRTYGCYYFPLGVVAPGLVSRVVALHWNGLPRQGGVFLSFYAARLVSLVTVDAALLFFLFSVPWLRSTVLAFFTIPMMIEQSVSIGHDDALFGLCLLIVALVLSRRDWAAVVIIALAATLMTLIKPIFACFGMLALPMIVELKPSWRPLRWKSLLALSWLVPLPAYGIWFRLGGVQQRMWAPSFVHADRQMLQLLQHPWRFITIMVGYLHYLIDDHRLPDFVPRRINGEWTTLFFANLWLTMPWIGAALAALGLALAMTNDATSPPHPVEPPGPAPRRLRLARLAAAGGVAATVPATILALYLTYTPVGAPGPYAVQGRYHACAWLTLSLLGVDGIKRRWPFTLRRPAALALGALGLMLSGCGYALATIWSYYWS